MGCRQSHAVVASHRRLEAAAERCPMDRGDHGLGGVLDALQHDVQTGSALAIAAGGDLPELFDVGPGDEGPSAADQDDGFYRVVALEQIDAGTNAFGNSWTQRIHGRIVDGDDSEVPIAGGENKFAHCVDCNSGTGLPTCVWL